MLTDDFNYPLPDELIAQTPAIPRDSCRLLVVDRATDERQHLRFSDVLDFINTGDVLVVNETRVLPARLHGKRAGTGGEVEVLILKEVSPNTWDCLVKPGRKARLGEVIEFQDVLTGTVTAMKDDGIREIEFESAKPMSVLDAFHKIGEMPLPPYITEKIDDPELYQTVFSCDEHSAAAPTAGLHFTQELLDQARAKGIEIAKVRLDVGLDTFRPVSEDDPRDHHIHTEYYEVPQATVDCIEKARARGNRIVAVGTTATRALESAYKVGGGTLVAASGPTSLYILPGYSFGVVDALITNFHVPRSTLMMMVSAFASREQIMSVYAEAIEEHYRFLSFGDAVFIL